MISIRIIVAIRNFIDFIALFMVVFILCGCNGVSEGDVGRPAGAVAEQAVTHKQDNNRSKKATPPIPVNKGDL